MDFATQLLSGAAAGRAQADGLLVVLAGKPDESALDTPLKTAIGDAVAQGDLVLAPAKLAYLGRVAGVAAPRVAVAVAADGSAKAVKAAAAAGLGVVKSLGVRHLAVQLAGTGTLNAAQAEAIATAAGDAAYLYRTTKPSAPAAPVLAKLTVLAATKAERGVADAALVRAGAIVKGATLARELANRPGNHCTPTMLAQEARRMAREHGLKIEILGRKEIEKLGMGSFLAVAQGSDEPPRLIVLRYSGAARSAKPLVLVGKGITFDSGGISLKPGEAMDEMKFDMGGAASVIGAMRAVAQLAPKVNVVGVVAACENLPSGRSVKPGDVVTSMSGQTIEILNTDAEGRLILCDALTYARRFDPAAVVDIATLTGACVVALGHIRSGMYASDDELAAQLSAAGEAALDPCWRMPLDDDYAEGLKSNFADVANIAGRPGGSITAAKFLQRFATELRWGHLDIAGTAWKGGQAKGATGRPVGLLTHWILANARAD